MPNSKVRAWTLDQIAKSEFFHQKLHSWYLIEVAQAIEEVKGEELSWELASLGISAKAWNKVIHRGIRPVMIFAHPAILTTVRKSVGYYRMMSLVSQKSMIQVRLTTVRYENGDLPKPALAVQFCLHLNKIISILVESDEEINPREFELWRGMAAGSQAQGSWQNNKGNAAEVVIRGQFRKRIAERGLAQVSIDEASSFTLKDGRSVVFADEPDIAFYRGGAPLAAVEIKGGIDTAGVLERVGAAIKSLSRTRHENPDSVTILIVQEVSVSEQARRDLDANKEWINHWFTYEDMLENDEVREKVFTLLEI